MVISRKFQCIYINIGKVASKSFETALQQCGGGEANIWLGHKYGGHIMAIDLRERISEDIWDNYLKVATIRCPYDWMISRYYWRQHVRQITMDFEQFVAERGMFRIIYGLHEREAEQSTGIKRLLTDFLIRYEHLNKDIKELEIRINCPGLSDTFQSMRRNAGIRPKVGTAAYEMYAKYPAAKTIIDERCKEAAKEYEFFGRYWPDYKARLEDAIKAHGACPK